MSPTVPDLHVILVRARDGSPAAIRELYEAYGAAVRHYCSARLGDGDAAQACAQDVFVRIYQGVRTFEYRGDASFTAWLYTIADHVVVRYAGTWQRAQQVSLIPGLNVADGRSSDAAGTRWDRVLLGAAIQHLTREQQQVIVLKFFGGLSTSEMATVLGQSEDAIKALQYHALSRLQQLLSAERSNQRAALPLEESA